MTYNKALELLREAGIENPETDAAVLFEHFAGVAPHSLPFRRDEDFSSPELLSALQRRQSREPLQYVLGFWEFCGLRFTLNRDCLCPRPDTELIVELAVKNLPKSARFCDVGTGSGAIAVSILHLRRDATAVGFDINAKALAAAQTNARLNAVDDRITFSQADALADGFLANDKFDAVISNPPYIPAHIIPTLAPEVLLEPHRALDGGADGLVFYRAITRKAVSALASGGFVLYEVGIGQAEDVAEIGRSLGFSAEIFKDLGGIDRAVLLRKN
ncbi:MAG: peptide chain release factor N(5)-glutamine methyltransferase [Eubacteriales bacterium]